MVTTRAETLSWHTFISVGRRELTQEDIDRSITLYSESEGAPRYAGINPRYRDTFVQDYLISCKILPRFAGGISVWEIWLSTFTIPLGDEGRDLKVPAKYPALTDEERGLFYNMSEEEGILVPTVTSSKKGVGKGRGRSKLMHNGVPREEWIQQEFRKGRTRREIADELDVRYQIVFAATKGINAPKVGE